MRKIAQIFVVVAVDVIIMIIVVVVVVVVVWPLVAKCSTVVYKCFNKKNYCN